MKKAEHDNRISLTEIKRIELELLLYVHSVCTKNKIRYSLMFGTLLGAVRHKGFIPWDDDIDICVPMPDYERLIHLLQKENRYVIRCDFLESEYYYWHAKLVDPRTLAIEANRPTDPKMGIWIDIFPLCGIPEDRPIEVLWNEMDKANRRVFCSIKNYYMFCGGFIPKTIAKAVLRLPYAISCKSKGTEWWKEKRRSLYHEMPYHNASLVGILPTPYREKSVFPQNFFESYSTIEFEGHELMCVERWNEVLSMIYGDYMTLPPVEERNTSHLKAFYR